MAWQVGISKLAHLSSGSEFPRLIIVSLINLKLSMGICPYIWCRYSNTFSPFKM